MGASVLLATDFDGTIAPIVEDPSAAAMHPAARAFLASVEVPVAVLSGRDVEDVRARIHGLRAIVAGAHGLECEDADGRALWTCPRMFPQPPAELLASLRRFRIERKKFSMAVHYRGMEPDGIEPFAAWARGEELTVIPGRMVVEARVPGGGKGAALQRIAEHVGAQRVLYAGDDTTDFDALAYAAAHGRAAFMTSAERAAPDVPGLVHVASVEELCAFFAREL
jgi:trehalose-phosphatase